jgi:hypothetical protein
VEQEFNFSLTLTPLLSIYFAVGPFFPSSTQLVRKPDGEAPVNPVSRLRSLRAYLSLRAARASFRNSFSPFHHRIFRTLHHTLRTIDSFFLSAFHISFPLIGDQAPLEREDVDRPHTLLPIIAQPGIFPIVHFVKVSGQLTETVR